MKTDLKRFDVIESALRQGHADAARRDLILSTRGRLSRKAKARAAQLARFAGVPQLGLQLLHPVVRSKKSRADADPERLEYAASLMALGANREALSLLATIKTESLIDKELLQALIYIGWKDPTSSQPFLVRYLEAEGTDPQQTLIVRLNLISARIQLNQPVDKELADALAETAGGESPWMRGTALELAAQQALYRNEWDEAERHLDEATETFGKGGFQFFIRKWRAILSLRRSRGSAESVREIENLKEDARRTRQWEVARDLDKHLTLVVKDRPRFLHLYFGTPFEAYRRDLLNGYGLGGEVPESYEWRLGPPEYEPQVVDLSHHAKISTLASDFYRPMRPAEVFEAWGTGEAFDPFTTLDHVREEISILKGELKNVNFPLTIDEVPGGYQLSPTESCRVRVSIQSSSPSTETA